MILHIHKYNKIWLFYLNTNNIFKFILYIHIIYSELIDMYIYVIYIIIFIFSTYIYFYFYFYAYIHIISKNVSKLEYNIYKYICKFICNSFILTLQIYNIFRFIMNKYIIYSNLFCIYIQFCFLHRSI